MSLADMVTLACRRIFFESRAAGRNPDSISLFTFSL